jgi:hypothetical protein
MQVFMLFYMLKFIMHTKNELISMLSNLNPKLYFNYKIYLAKQKIQTEKIFLLKDIESLFYKSVNLTSRLNWTNELTDSDFILVPHLWNNIKKDKVYLRYLSELSKSKILVIFNLGDESGSIPLKNSIQLKNFIHPWQTQLNTIIIPYNVRPRNFVPRAWKKKPDLSFVGFCPELSRRALLSFSPKSLFYPIKSSVYLNRNLGIKRLEKFSDRIQVHLLLNNNYAAFSKNFEAELQIKRYNQSLTTTDYVFCPRGFGNGSMRLYEVLSAGRIPIIPETDSGFPLTEIDPFFNRSALIVKYFSNWEKNILSHWESLEYNYSKLQIDNHEFFDNHLNIENYLSKLFLPYLRV